MYRADKINLLLPLLLELLLWTPKISRIPEINLFNCYQDSGRENITLNELLESYYLHTFWSLHRQPAGRAARPCHHQDRHRGQVLRGGRPDSRGGRHKSLRETNVYVVSFPRKLRLHYDSFPFFAT